VRRFPRAFVVASVLVLTLTACPAGPPGPADKDAVVDASPDAKAEEDAPPARTPRALILDQQLGGRVAWIDVIDALETAGFEVHHRRYYPHLSAADSTYSLVIMAAGNAPAVPASTMRLAELANARKLVEGGGALLLAPLSSFHDSNSGENDWFLFNRLLEELEVDIRIDKNTVIGAAWTGSPAPPHVDTEWAYAPTLEMALGYPYLEPTAGHPTSAGVERVAGGSVPTLRVTSDEVDVLLRTHDKGYIWRYFFTGDPSQRVVPLDRERAVAALARAKRGYLAVVGRATLSSLGGLAGSASDKPARDLLALDSNRRFLSALFSYLRQLVAGVAAFKVHGPLGKDQSFTVATQEIPAIGSGPVLKVSTTINQLAVPDKPPATDEDLLELAPGGNAAPVAAPSWFGKGGARIAYGDLTQPLSAMTAAFGEILAHDLDALLTGSQPERLTRRDPQPWRDNHLDVAQQASSAGARWIASGFINTYWAENPGVYPRMVGAQGQQADGPAPLDDKFWSEVMIPTYAAVGELAKQSPGIFGLSFDLELYQAAQLWHTDGYAFSSSTLAAFTSSQPGAPHKSKLEQLPAEERLDYLVDQGLLKSYFHALEHAAFLLGRSCREAARKEAPHLELLVYVPVFPSSWFYHGLLRGLGTPARPVVVLTFEPWADRARRELNAQGVQMAHVGGTLASHWRPQDLAQVLPALAAGSGGYWYLSFNDFSSTNTKPPSLHGTGVEYWAAVDAANKTLDQ
jgi:hypothetical protein